MAWLQSLNREKHIWLIPMDSTFTDTGKYLAADELARSQRLYFAGDRKRFVFFRSALRLVLSQYCQEKPGDIVFEYNQFGKPFIKNCGLKVNFNFSHSDSLAVCAVMEKEDIGVDVELIQEEVDIDAISAQFFSDSEKNQLKHSSGEEKLLNFYSIWTGKEAYGKALGCGILFPLEAVTIPITPSSFSRNRLMGIDGKQWSIESFRCHAEGVFFAFSCVHSGGPLPTEIFVLRNGAYYDVPFRDGHVAMQ